MRTLASIVQVRRARPEDAAVVLDMVRGTAAHEGSADAVAGTPGTWAAMLARDDVVVLLAERDGTPVGYVSAVRTLQLRRGRDILCVDDLFVRPGSRHAGVGRLLVLELARLARAGGMAIRCELRAGDADAQRFHAGLGATLRSNVVASWPTDARASAPTGPPRAGA